MWGKIRQSSRNLILISLLFFYLLLNSLVFFPRSKPKLRVLTFHHIKRENFQKIKRMLIFLSRNWTFITPEDFENIISKQQKYQKQNSLLITFDDGFYSQKDFTKEILDELGIKAIFFCIPELIMLADERKVLQFLEENLKIKYCISFQNFPTVNMKLKDLLSLRMLDMLSVPIQ